MVGERREHALFRCSTPAEFLAQFERQIGCGLMEVLSRLVEQDVNGLAVVLAGSIPLGIGTATSDIDLFVLSDTPISARSPAREGGVLFWGTFGENPGPESAEAVLVLGGLEVHILFLAAPGVETLAARVRGANVSLTVQEVALLSRLKTGWVLTPGRVWDRCCGPLLDDDSLEVHCATRYLTTALQGLEDARAALAESTELALHLGRSCVEGCFAAYLASRGCAHGGAKWLRLLKRDPTGRFSPAGEPFQTLVKEGVALLFPTPSDASTPADYLERVGGFARALRSVIEKDPTFLVAFALCPQLDPNH